MKFLVSRTSVWREEETPCEEATPTMVQHWDQRTFRSPEEHDQKLGVYANFKPWLSEGTEHEIVRGPRGGARGIRRRMDDCPGWEVEIPDLVALMQFVNKYGDVIVKEGTESWPYDPRPALEIYDGYRE